MYLKALEIEGFKSFPDKTVLRFGEDITAIVGPNGSGKSNISDAICWVMGEQSARSLRGSKMEDVIFGGTEKRGAMRFAQVTLVLDNSTHVFPSIDASEVMVTRRYNRSGESEYFINKQSVRLRDINELFMDTGLGREGYSIIGQGRIDEILSVKSADRREIFEEAAGISKFRHRKEETERKMQRTEENLVRINDKIAELELQVEPLRKQAETAKKYLVLRDELRVLEISVWMEKLEELRSGAIRLRAELSAAQAVNDRAREELEQLYQANETFSQRQQENEIAQEALRQKAADFESRAVEQESDVALLESNIQHSRQSIALLEREMAEQDNRSQTIQEQMEDQRRRIGEIHQRSEALQRELTELLEKARQAALGAGSAAQEAQALRAQEALAVADAADARVEASALRSAMEQMEQRKLTIDQDLQAAQAQVDTARKDQRRAKRDLEDAQDEADAVRNIIQGHTLRMEGRVKREETAAQNLMDLTMEQNNLLSRIRMLTEMEKEYEGFNKAVKVVMQAAERNTLRGVHGPVASLIRAEGKYAVALEIALGAGMQNIVVDREEDAKSAINFLKQRDGGRATFLPLTAIRGDELRERGLEEEFGFVGIASQLIEYDKKYDNIFKNLLGRTVVAEDMDCGIAMARKYQNRFRIVTLDGQIINRGGSMTGGSVSRSAGILSRSNELEALKHKQGRLEEKLSEARREKEDAARELAAARYEMEVAETQRRSAEDAVLRLQGDVNHYRVLLEGLERNVENLEGEKASLDQRVSDSRESVKGLEEKIAALDAQAAQLKQQAQEKLSGQTELMELSGRLGEDVSQRKQELSGLAAEEEATAKALADMEQVCRDFAGDQSSRQQRLEEYSALILATEGQIAQKTEAAASLRMEAAGCQKELDELRRTKLELEQERNAMSQKLRQCNEDVIAAQQEVTRLEGKLSAGALEENQILDKLWENYELSHSAAMEQRVELESLPKANRRINELKREINGLGNVNVGAIEEFDRVNARYTYFTEQRDDVEKAKGELAGIVEEITKEMTAIFAEQFKLINATFQETFLDLFGGGQAKLELEDPNDILGCGIEIKVQPPGKTLKALSLLSGGEKAFVAIALYYAILKVHPTPFCVMDEIEAALDEANVVRYARYMRNISDKTQFIVITHRRGTMEEADVLYGVTMQEKGVSKMLTINLNDVAKELKIK